MDVESVPLLSTAKRVACSCLPCGKTTVGSFRIRIGPKFAEGGFSSVYRCTDDESGEKYALKMMIASESEQIDHIHAEIRIHQQFQHPNLLRLLDFSETQENGKTIFRLLFPMYGGGSVGDVIARMRGVGKIFSEERALRIFSEVLRAVNVMHSAKPAIAHHDIKPENVLLSEDNHVVLMDFGSACKANYDTNDRKEAARLKDWAAEHCTMPYRAPELFEPRTYAVVNATSDVWSLGCLLFAMAFGLSPFEAKLDNTGKRLQYVECSYLRVLNEIPFPKPTNFSKKFVALVRSMLVVDPTMRPTVPDVLKIVDGMRSQKSKEKTEVHIAIPDSSFNAL